MIEQKKQLAKLAMFQNSRAKIEQRVVRFNEIVRQEVIYAYTLDIPQTEIAKALGVTKGRVWQIIQEHKKKVGE